MVIKCKKLKIMPQAKPMCKTKGEGMGKVQSNISRKHKIILNKKTIVIMISMIDIRDPRKKHIQQFILLLIDVIVHNN